ncbi:MAG: hypothetical protein P4L49_08255 [Desulfosporosinus sp.]|nr:hypothetical protein [Desulfosporosinus sp.]
MIEFTLANVLAFKMYEFITKSYGIANNDLGVLSKDRIFFIQMRAITGKLFANRFLYLLSH